MPDTDPPWEGNVNEAVVEEWKAETTPFERVREVLLSTTNPQYAKELAERARVSEPTARKHLQILVEAGIAQTERTGRGEQYKRSRQTVAMQRISELHTQLSREELANGIQDLREQVQAYQDDFDATTPDDLALQIESAETDEWTAVSEWRALEKNLHIAQAALALYDFTPDSGDRTEASGGNGTRGAFAHRTDSGTLV
ncbi:winged helix-turn-helix domain-containing protein [Haladaptatus caseinilyticus]|uniref:winged helix-turn-helix domain-containing protein n=1 Tax=Haladaptatus caseinilyticus TaxID=2993314 RepID=UPI00224B0F9B|nr:winged helix-turn-helix domain-containing protein [Haladaptatus caseinilyticus]